MYNCYNDLNKLTELSGEYHIKYLGVLMDTNLSWKYYVEYVLNKASKTIGLISKLRHFVPKHILLNIYKSLTITPYLFYSVIAWGQTCKTNWMIF